MYREVLKLEFRLQYLWQRASAGLTSPGAYRL